jgi:hypothetical protein
MCPAGSHSVLIILSSDHAYLLFELFENACCSVENLGLHGCSFDPEPAAMVAPAVAAGSGSNERSIAGQDFNGTRA